MSNWIKEVAKKIKKGADKVTDPISSWGAAPTLKKEAAKYAKYEYARSVAKDKNLIDKNTGKRREPGDTDALGDANASPGYDYKKMAINDRARRMFDVPVFKQGGMVKKTGLAHLHKGEHVLTAQQVKVIKALEKVLG